jgi:hypothetical protein
VTSADAQTPRAVRRGGFLLSAALLAGLAHGVPATAAAEPRHDLTVAGKEIGGDSDRFKLFGRVPTYPGQDLRIERKVNKGPFEVWASEATSADQGRFSIRVYGGKRGSTVCYRVVVPATAEHRRTQGERWCITTRTR